MIILGLVALVLADLPVHCTYKQLLGDWEFFLNSKTFEASLDNEETFCGHGQPDKVLNLDKYEDFGFEQEIKLFVSFEEPNYAYSDEYGAGVWTTVYDEGFLLDFEEISFFTYFFYYKEGKQYQSDCGRTTLGWYRGRDPKDHSAWGCFYAKKVSGNDVSEFIQSATQWLGPEYSSFLQISEILYDDSQKTVDRINSLQNSWKAELNPRFLGLTLLEINQNFGNKPLTPPKASPPLENPSKPEDIDLFRLTKTDFESLLYYWDTPLSSIPSDSLPVSWDWSDVDGVSYVPKKVRDQGKCGSCYAITTVQMLESRLKLLTNNQFQDYLSEQYLISCSFYTEGCDGGFPTLLNKFIQEFDVIPEKCSEYKANDKKCISKCKAGFTVGVSDYYYVGGYYGATDEENMMKELRARGPFIADFKPEYDFMYYKEGIYSSVSNRKSDEKISNDNMRDYNIDWESVNHSVLLVGWGEENGEKFWKLLNSWGDDWGEKGFFRIRRGSDECAVESMAEGAVPYINLL